MEVGAFASLVIENQIPQVVHMLEAAVFKTFVDDASPGRIILVNGSGRTMTRDKVRERTAKALNIFRVLRGDLKWSLPRIEDALAGLLRKELDGIPWEPDARRSSWSTTVPK